MHGCIIMSRKTTVSAPKPGLLTSGLKALGCYAAADAYGAF